MTVSEPAVDPDEDPGADPGTDPGTDPGNDPGTDPGTNEATAVTVPAAPVGLIRSVVQTPEGNQFRLDWTDASAVETRYEVERKTSSDFVTIATLPANTTGFSERVVPGHPRYRVRACNAAGCSSYATD